MSLRDRALLAGPVLCGSVLLAALAGPLAGQEAPGARDSAAAEASRGRGPGVPTMRAVRRKGPVRVDGRLDEAAWGRAPAATGFVQGVPAEGAEPSRRTEVRILYDAEALYVGARLHDDPGAVADQLVRRDERGQYDYFEVLFDPNLDRQTGYLFRVSAAGQELDAYFFDDSRRDVNWDAVWSSAVHRDSTGWSLEMQIPLSQIRFESSDTTQTWGVNFQRRRLASNSASFYALVSRTVEGVVSQSGRLEGLRLTEAERRFEVEPYVATQLFTGPAEPGDPFFDGSELDPRAGVNVQYGIGSAFSLDATVNPDFGQVEVDPAVVNLTAFETFFPEKRPFFVQDARVFDFDLSGRRSRLFFSRRIGREPARDDVEGAAFAEAPDRTTILGASKFTGRTQGGLSVGVLGAVTQGETGRALMEGTGQIRDFVAEPPSQYGVVRVQQDFREGTSRVGAIVTGVNRDLPDSGALDALPSSAFSGGVDFQHQWGGPRSRRWSLSGYFAATHVRGSPEAITEIQTNPQHYFQRPDADDLSVDSTATQITGYNWSLDFARQSGEHWTWATSIGEYSPDFAANDLGFSTEGEQLNWDGRVRYQEIDPGPLFRSWSVSFFTFHEFRHELLDDVWSAGQWADAHKNGHLSLNSEFELHNNWSVDLGLDYSPATLSDTETRGGPLMSDPADVSAEFRLQTDRRRTLSLGPSVEYRKTYSGGGRSWELGLDVSVRPSSSFELEMEPSVTFEDDASQFVETTGAVPYAPTFGDRYLFADLGQTEFGMETRLNVAFSPALSLQLFLQPLVSAGDFAAYKQLARPSSFDFLPFSEGSAVPAPGGGVTCSGGTTCVEGDTRHFDLDGDGTVDFSTGTRDFNFKSLRGNAVLRWEYRPGSTLFLVWQQNRQAESRLGSFNLDGDFREMLSAPSENTFIVKVSHFLEF